jgi:hypothetical protein
MGKLVVEEQLEYPTLPDDSIIHVKLESTEVRTVNGARGDWTKLECTFKILGIQNVQAPGDHVDNYANLIGQRIYGSVPYRLTTSEENKLRIWSEALLGRELGLGFELDTDYLTGREARAVTSTYEKRNINPKTGQPFKAHQVATLLPMAGAGAPQTTQSQAPQQAPSAWGAPGTTPQQAPQQQRPQDPWAPQGGFSDEPPF